MRLGAIVVLAGCSNILGIDDVTFPDPGTPNTVTGKTFIRCLANDGPHDLAIDQSTAVIQAFIPDASLPAGYRVVDGVGRVDGTWEIDDVPDGAEYVLKVTKSYFVTDQHVIEHFFEQPGRCEPKPASATAETLVSFDVTGMQAFSSAPNQVFDQLQIRSFNIGYQTSNPLLLLNGANKATFTFDWSTEPSIITGDVPLPDETVPDDLFVFHVRTEPVDVGNGRIHPFTHVVDAFASGPITLQDGVSKAITGSFTPGVNKSIDMFMRRGSFDAAYDGATLFSNAHVSVFGQPIADNFGLAQTLADVDFSDWSRSTNLDESVTVGYRDPLPTDYARFLRAEYRRIRKILVPGTTTPGNVNAFYDHTEPTVMNFAGQIRLLPPSGAKVAGVDLASGGNVAFDGVAPVELTWNAVTGAKLYIIVVFRVFANGPQTKTQGIATLSTTNTSLAIPAEVFVGGEFFAFTVAAVSSPASYATGQVITTGLPEIFAATPSGLFRVGSKCGNHVVDLGEDCDDGGESATCDVDCTFVQCGDGLRNATAGEICDAVTDSAGCDSDCTLPVCGDGHVNPQSEDCDEVGNGCAACKFANVCGNGITEVSEECDVSGGGDQVSCDSDCTLPQCGDGHFNPMTEGCDDGNGDDGDGCHNDCTIE